MVDHFGFLAPFYERFIHPPYETDWPALLDTSHSQNILDIGGGTGRVAQLISGNDQKIFILDASLRMLSESRAKGLQLTACGFSERLPFNDQAFDRILMVDAFHHLKDQIVSGDEMWRVLKPGGRLVIEEPDIRQFAVKLISLGEKLLLMRSHFWQAEKIASLFQNLPCQVQILRKNNSAWIIINRN